MSTAKEWTLLNILILKALEIDIDIDIDIEQAIILVQSYIKCLPSSEASLRSRP